MKKCKILNKGYLKNVNLLFGEIEKSNPNHFRIYLERFNNEKDSDYAKLNELNGLLIQDCFFCGEAIIDQVERKTKTKWAAIE